MGVLVNEKNAVYLYFSNDCSCFHLLGGGRCF